LTPPPFDLARSLVRYEPAVRQLVQRLKYAGDTSVARGISQIIRGGDLSDFADCDWIIPVPLHVARHRRRGLNQATILASLFFPHKTELIRADWLIRTRHTIAQTSLGGIARRKNLAGAFAVRNDKHLEGAMICLVDDVYTTGTTVGECARALGRHGARVVKVLTLARVAVPQRGRMR
jgi:ComF family protein